eukprot:Seg233.2 transcript_id=Seg233.2/GoldUCD/mRNA.D3Y31 product="hypothetical protein" protein_id=Seg233.2/GoldUCD/D3Y31
MELKDNCNNLTAIVNHCKNSTSLASVQVPSYNIPLKFRVLQITEASLVLVTSVILNGLLLTHLKKRQENARQRRPTEVDTLIFSISVVSIVVVSIGIPLLIFLLAVDFQPYTVCDYVKFAQYHILFYGSSLILHFIAAILFDRFAVLTNYKYKINANNIKAVISAIVIYVTIFWSVLIVMRVNEARVNGELGFDHCFNPMYVHLLGREAEAKAYGDVIMIVVWITACNVCFARCTRKTLRHIKKINKMTKENPLSDQIEPIETRRVKVAFLLGIIYDLVWVPFGIIAVTQFRVDVQISSIVKEFLVATSYTSFMVFPLVYAQMDKRFLGFLRQHIPCLKASTVEAESHTA